MPLPFNFTSFRAQFLMPRGTFMRIHAIHSRTVRSLCFVIFLLVAAAPMFGQAAQLSADNPFARASTLPYEAPPFDRIKEADYRPAFEAGMAEERKEVEAIARNTAAPTLENTI